MKKKRMMTCMETKRMRRESEDIDTTTIIITITTSMIIVANRLRRKTMKMTLTMVSIQTKCSKMACSSSRI